MLARIYTEQTHFMNDQSGVRPRRSSRSDRRGLVRAGRVVASASFPPYGEHLSDQVAAYDWLKQQPFVAANRIAVAGNSFGGIETVLGAERIAYCAAVDAAGASQSWALAPELHGVMVGAARASHAPMFVFQAENDFDLSPSRTLEAAMRDAGKIVESKIYPPFGKNRADGPQLCVAWQLHLGRRRLGISGAPLPTIADVVAGDARSRRSMASAHRVVDDRSRWPHQVSMKRRLCDASRAGTVRRPRTIHARVSAGSITASISRYEAVWIARPRS